MHGGNKGLNQSYKNFNGNCRCLSLMKATFFNIKAGNKDLDFDIEAIRPCLYIQMQSEPRAMPIN